MSRQSPTTPEPSISRLFLPPTSTPRNTRRVLSQGIVGVGSSTPEPRSENDIGPESPSSILGPLHANVGAAWRPWHPLTPQESRRHIARANRLWPVVDPGTRRLLDDMKSVLNESMREQGIRSYSVTVGLHGTTSESGIPKLVILTGQFLTHDQRLRIPPSVKFVNLRLRTRQASHDSLLDGYKETADPGSMIGTNDRPLTSFSNGWWVRDCSTGSVFNLSAAHPLRSTHANQPSHQWSVHMEDSYSQTVDCPPLCAINALRLNFRRELQECQAARAYSLQIDPKQTALERLQRDVGRRDYATVVSAGYGEYERVYEDGRTDTLIEDWSLLRAKSDRVGRNIFPPEFNGTRQFTGVGELKLGQKCFLNGATSGVKEGTVWDEILIQAHEHDSPTKSWIVRSVNLDHFGTEGDSGAPIGLEGGLAGGIYVSGGVGMFDDGEETGVFEFSIVVSLKDTIRRIQEVTGRVLEVPTEYDLSRKFDRDRYHLEKTGDKRVRH